MLNNVILIGRIVNDPELEQTPKGKKVSTITLAIARSFKNSNGVFETDYITCRLWSGIAESMVEFCKKGSLLAIKGRLQTRNYDTADGHRMCITEVIAERVNFLNS